MPQTTGKVKVTHAACICRNQGSPRTHTLVRLLRQFLKRHKLISDDLHTHHLSERTEILVQNPQTPRHRVEEVSQDEVQREARVHDTPIPSPPGEVNNFRFVSLNYRL